MSYIEDNYGHLKVNDLVLIKFLFSREEPYIGIITSITVDLNFGYIFEAITNKGKILSPSGVAEIEKI
jgi:hypothetical protein